MTALDGFLFGLLAGGIIACHLGRYCYRVGLEDAQKRSV